MITIIHGENTKNSRNYFLEIKSKAINPITFSPQTLNALDLLQVLSGNDLFNMSKEIFIEDLFLLKKVSEKEKIINVILENSKENQIIIYESKEVTLANLKPFKNADIKKFDVPILIFNFLDSIGMDNKKAINLFRDILKTEQAEYIFFMILRHFRIMLALSTSQATTSNLSPSIDEVKRMAPWQKNKYLNQIKKIKSEKLREIYSYLFNTDLKQKTGTNTLSLVQAIDLLLLKI